MIERRNGLRFAHTPGSEEGLDFIGTQVSACGPSHGSSRVEERQHTPAEALDLL
jgi:hypothetical protein